MTPRRTHVRAVIQKIQGAAVAREKDQLAAEEPLEIRAAGSADGKIFDHAVAVTMRTPGDDYELAAGFLYTEGLLRAPADLREITYCVGADKLKQQYNVVRVRLRDGVAFDAARLQRNFYASSSCGLCGKASLDAVRAAGCVPVAAGGPALPLELIHGLAGKLRSRQPVFEKTGGLHAAALFDAAGELLSLREDIGRHNATDKAIGERFLAGKAAPVGHVLFVSGRASFEIMQKAAMAGVPVVAAVGAPSSLALDFANEFGQTLLGFVRDRRFNVYTHPERIAL